MSIFTKKILQFMDKYWKQDYDININIDHIFIKNIIDIIKETHKTHYDYKYESYFVEKLHDELEFPLLFALLDKLEKRKVLDKNINIGNFDEFVDWYRVNHMNYNFKGMNRLIKSKEENNIYNAIFNQQKLRKDLHEMLYENNFVSLDIQQHAETVNMTYYIYDNDDFLLKLYIPENISDMYDYDIDKIIHIIFMMSSLAKKYGLYRKKPNVRIFLGLQKKFITNDNDDDKIKILCSDNINSGSTLRGEFVNIWRMEEVYKVLIHELVHFFEIDFYCDNNLCDTFSKQIMDKYNVNYFDSQSEAYTECLAVIIRSCLFSYYNGNDLKETLMNEMKFTMFQISKILNYYRMEQLGKGNIIQTTSVFSYFIVKGAFLYNLTKFMDFAIHININDKISKYYDLIDQLMNQEYTAILTNNVRKYKTVEHCKKCFVMKTLRMTCY